MSTLAVFMDVFDQEVKQLGDSSGAETEAGSRIFFLVFVTLPLSRFSLCFAHLVALC